MYALQQEKKISICHSTLNSLSAQRESPNLEATTPETTPDLSNLAFIKLAQISNNTIEREINNPAVGRSNTSWEISSTEPLANMLIVDCHR